MIEFIEECRQEWKRLGVPDPIANEMAADLTADIEEAESEGGSAEDVLGTSLFDPRRFAAAWAGARGVTAPTFEPVSFEPAGRERSRWYRPVAAAAVTAGALLTLLVAAALVVGRHGSAVAAPVRRILEVPGSARAFVPGSASPPVRFSVPGPSFVVESAQPVAIIVLALLLVGILALGLALLYWSPWFRRGSKRRFG